MSTAEKIFAKARSLPDAAQAEVLSFIEQLAVGKTAPPASQPMTLEESAELRGKLAAWEEDWNAPGMEVYDRV